VTVDVTVPIVRLARRDDAAAIADAHVRGWLAAYRGLVPDAVLDGLSIERRTGFWRDTIAAETAADATPARTWAVEVAGRVVGFASTGPIRDRPEGIAGAGEVFAIYLAPEARGRGIGRTLFTHAVDDLTTRRFAPLVVWVFEGNVNARRFYEAAAFEPDGARQPVDFGEVSIPEIRYRRG
jgi:GNAT superfamily N-acetyltransferase